VLILRYGLMKRLKRGVRVKIFPSFNCTLGCDYCGNKLENTLKPKDTENNYNLADWINLIDNFPIPVREVVISGGEPTEWPSLANLSNWILDSGRFLEIYTNLINTNLLLVDKSRKFRILATKHKKHSVREFDKNYTLVHEKHENIDVKEIDANTLWYSRKVPFTCTVELAHLIQKKYFWISPDGAIFPNCYGAMKHNDQKID